MAKLEDQKPDFLVCAPADAQFTARGSVFDKACSKCGTRVMMAPTGQRVMAKFPDLEILCMGCFYALPADQEQEHMLAGTPEEIAGELASSVVPNQWKNRN